MLEVGRGEGWNLAWPLERAEEALELLALESGLVRRTSPAADESDTSATSQAETQDEATSLPDIEPRLTAVVDRLGLEIEAVDTPHDETEALIQNCGPALLRIVDPATGSESPQSANYRLLAVLGPRRRGVSILAPDLTVHRVSVSDVRDWLCREIEAPVLPKVERLLTQLQATVKVTPRRADRARQALLRERLRRARIRHCWLLRRQPGASFWQQMTAAGTVRHAAQFLGLYVIAYGLVLTSWWVLGQGALSGHLSRDWLLAWALLLITSVVPHQGSLWTQAKIAASVGTLLKRRLLQGALRLEPDEIRRHGAGQLLGRVIESEALQTHALQGGFLAILGGLEVAMSGWVLSQGAMGGLHLLLLGVWLLVVGVVGWRYLVRRQEWTDDRLAMTHDLVESLVGHRTRLAQERREDWHQREDRLLETYLGSSRRVDWQRALLAVSAFAWILIGIVGLLPAFVSGSASTAALALSIGGVLLGFRAFSKLTRGFSYLAGAWISWQQAGPIFHAAGKADAEGVGGVALSLAPRPEEGAGRGGKVLEAQDLVYRYPGRVRAVLDGCQLELFAGDRVLIEGPSGGGKSTLAGLLTRLRSPDSGLLLLGGLDPHTIPAAVWRRHVVAAPQFHENHVFTETFAFNLLMGRGWPPRRQDMADASAVCEELGLGELLQRMPAGLLQVVGETGWQLSHGERGRLFMARALLQGADIVILDESFAALDPENFQRALACALRRAPTLLIIAHP